MDKLLEIKNLHLYFNFYQSVLKALNGVDLVINEREILGLVGETGSGKSITALSTLQLIPSSGSIVKGTIIFQGENLLDKTENQMKDLRGNLISMIFQNPRESLNPVFDVGKQLATVYLSHRQASKREAYDKVLEMMQAVGIADARAQINAYPHQLSGGICQRIMIAAALICSPKLLIADEPTTALDVTVQAEVLDLILDLVRTRGASCLFITHDLGVVSEICDRVAVMYAGHVVETGPVGEIFNNPLHPYTQGLIKSTLRVDQYQPISVIPGSVPDAATLPPGCPFHPRCHHAQEICEEIYPKAILPDADHSVTCHKISEGW